MDCSPPGSTFCGIFQLDNPILQWFATSYSRGSSQPRDWIRASCISCTGRQMLYHSLSHQGSPANIYCMCNLCQPLCSLLCLRYSFSPRQVLLLFTFNIRRLRPRRAKQLSQFQPGTKREERSTWRQLASESKFSAPPCISSLSLLIFQSTSIGLPRICPGYVWKN